MLFHMSYVTTVSSSKTSLIYFVFLHTNVQTDNVQLYNQLINMTVCVAQSGTSGRPIGQNFLSSQSQYLQAATVRPLSKTLNTQKLSLLNVTHSGLRNLPNAINVNALKQFIPSCKGQHQENLCIEYFSEESQDGVF